MGEMWELGLSCTWKVLRGWCQTDCRQGIHGCGEVPAWPTTHGQFPRESKVSQVKESGLQQLWSEHLEQDGRLLQASFAMYSRCTAV